MPRRLHVPLVDIQALAKCLQQEQTNYGPTITVEQIGKAERIVRKLIREHLDGKWKDRGEGTDDELLAKEFKPCVVVFDDPKRTEMVLADTAISWGFQVNPNVDLGHDMETGELVAIRVYGDMSRRRKSE